MKRREKIDKLVKGPWRLEGGERRNYLMKMRERFKNVQRVEGKVIVGTQAKRGGKKERKHLGWEWGQKDKIGCEKSPNNVARKE